MEKDVDKECNPEDVIKQIIYNDDTVWVNPSSKGKK